MARVPWTRDQLVIAFDLYCRTPFGRLHQRNPDVIALAQAIQRTPSAVAMKLSNFASLDPAEQARGIRGLSGASEQDREVFESFARRQDALLDECRQIAQRLGISANEYSTDSGADSTNDSQGLPTVAGPTEVERSVMTRRVQHAFRRAVLASYDSCCAICDIAVPSLLCASHIIPWRANVDRRADPTNGLALCALHDRAFDRGLFTVGEDVRVIVSSSLTIANPPILLRIGLIEIANRLLRLPRRFSPDPVALAYHRERVFAA